MLVTCHLSIAYTPHAISSQQLLYPVIGIRISFSRLVSHLDIKALPRVKRKVAESGVSNCRGSALGFHCPKEVRLLGGFGLLISSMTLSGPLEASQQKKGLQGPDEDYERIPPVDSSLCHELGTRCAETLPPIGPTTGLTCPPSDSLAWGFQGP